VPAIVLKILLRRGGIYEINGWEMSEDSYQEQINFSKQMRDFVKEERVSLTRLCY